MAVVFTIDGQSHRCEGEIIAIGRSPSNQISLPNDTRLTPVQAVLRLVSGRWIIEARDGGPIRVGNGRPTQFAWLSPNDVIHLTESGPEVKFALETVGPVVPSAATDTPPRPSPASSAPPPKYAPPEPFTAHSVLNFKPPAGDTQPKMTAVANADRSTSPTVPPWIVFVGMGGLAAAILIGVGAYLGGRGHPPAAIAGSSQVEKAPVTDIAPSTAEQPPAEKIPAADPRRGLYRLEQRTADRSKAVQLGTAWAVGPRTLITTGDAARGISLNQEFYPIPLARHSVTGEEFEIGGITLHPQFAIAADKREQADREIKDLLKELERSQDPDEQKKIEDQLYKLDAEAIQAFEETINVNIATLTVAKDLPGSLSYETSHPLKIGQQVTLMGHPISLKQTLVNPDDPTPVQQIIGRLQHTEPVRDPVVPLRCLVGFDDPQKELNWSGSPVLNAQGAVIGLYSNPTHPPPGVTSVPIETHDITLLDGVREWLPKSVKPHAAKK